MELSPVEKKMLIAILSNYRNSDACWRATAAALLNRLGGYDKVAGDSKIVLDYIEKWYQERDVCDACSKWVLIENLTQVREDYIECDHCGVVNED